ncbi:MAG TPA: hypothetical protein VMF56_00655 [Acidobacteriaceae bacterium]|nr:hypothetical protein [Acidobacteriaceae bacterium]
MRDPNNYCKRVLGELREKLNLPKLAFQVIRRTMATLSQTKGTVKDTQGICVTNDFQRPGIMMPEGVKQMID